MVNYITALFGISISIICNNDGKSCILLNFHYFTIITSVRIVHRRNKIVVLLKLLPCRAFPVDGRSAGPYSRKVIG